MTVKVTPPCAFCGCPELRHQHLHPRDYCGSCLECSSYTPRRARFYP